MIARKPVKPSTALARLQELCARSEQCSHEVLTKLQTWGIEAPIASKILALLRRDRFVNDSRYASAFVRDKVVFNRWGRVKIRLALLQKRLPADVIATALDEIDADEYRDALIEVLAAKARSLPETESFESRNKMLRHAASRGFESSMIVKLLKQPELWTPVR